MLFVYAVTSTNKIPLTSTVLECRQKSQRLQTTIRQRENTVCFSFISFNLAELILKNTETLKSRKGTRSSVTQLDNLSTGLGLLQVQRNQYLYNLFMSNCSGNRKSVLSVLT